MEEGGSGALDCNYPIIAFDRNYNNNKENGGGRVRSSLEQFPTNIIVS